jgi:membrane-associated phospholipid phosphatase
VRSKWRPLVRGVAAAAFASAIAAPILRRRLRLPAAATMTAMAAGPPALAVLAHRTRKRDAALYALAMWAFLMAHELPYDDPEALRRRLRIRYPIAVDRVIGGGRLPNARLQRALAGLGRRNVVDRFLSWVHWSWFIEPHAALVLILARHPERFARSARQMSAVFDLGCALYFALPTAPPWWASEHGDTDPEEVRRIMVEVGEKSWGRAWPILYDTLGGNPWAAMPSLHFATSLMAALLLAEAGGAEAALGWGYAAALGVALVYLGEHYVIDLLAGAAIVVAVRRGERLAEPLAGAVSRTLQRWERIAAS